MTHPNEALAALFGAVASNDLAESPRFNICPTEAVPVITSAADPSAPDARLRRLRPMRWGLIPGWYKTPDRRTADP